MTAADTSATREVSPPAVSAAGDSLTVAGWTVVSRLTGLVRVAVIGAVLGPTVLGNTFQFTNSLPNLIYYGLLGGSLFTSLLVPALVHSVDTGDRRASERLAGGFLGMTAVGLAVVIPIALVLAPAMLGITSSDAGGSGGGSQEGLARLLFLLFVPQVFCYAVVSVASATMNASRRFALAAAAPAMENVGIILVLGVSALALRTGSAGGTSLGQILVLGLGTTSAVAAHAALQWWGARRAGVTLRPFAGWRYPEVTELVRRAFPSLGQAALLALQMLVLLAAANRTPGGVVAFQIAISFVFLAVALGVTPVAVATLPWLARLLARGEREAFHDTFVRSLGLGLFVAAPAAVGCVLLAPVLARSVTVGHMATEAGLLMVTGALAALAVGILGQAVFTLCAYACYALADTRSPFLAAAVQVTVCISGAVVALLLLRGPMLAAGLGAAYSAGTIAGATFLAGRLSGRIFSGHQRLLPSLARTATASLVMSLPVWVTAHVLPSLAPGRLGVTVTVVAGPAVGIAAFLAVSFLLRAPELGWLLERVGRRAAVSGAT